VKNITKALIGVFLMLIAIAIVAATTGCKASQTTVAYRTVASVQAAARTSLDAWADYVVATRKQIAAMPADQQAAAAASLNSREVIVRVALSRYQQAAELAHAGVNVALNAGTTPAPAPLLDAGNQLVATVANLSK
jgi:hypothetical protein